MIRVDDFSLFDGTMSASPDAVSSKLGDELALLDFRTSTYFTLNGSGAFVWDLLQSPRSFDEICEEMGRVYDVDPRTCPADLSVLLTELADAKLIDIHDDAAI